MPQIYKLLFVLANFYSVFFSLKLFFVIFISSEMERTYSFRLWAVISETRVMLSGSFDIIRSRCCSIGVCKASGSLRYIPRARTIIIGQTPRRRNFNTSFSNGDWNPLTTAMSFCRLIFAAQSSVGIMSRVEA